MNHIRKIRAPRAQAGFSMIEVLVAVLLVSTALLSLALLQVVALRNSNSSFLRTEAVVLANDIADKMRANQVGVAGYVVALGANGTAGTVSGDDVISWKSALAAGLPNGDGSIAIASGVATITIRWQDSSSTEDQTGTGDSVNTQFIVRSTL